MPGPDDDASYRRLGEVLLKAFRESPFTSQRQVVEAVKHRVEPAYLSRALSGTQSLSLQALIDVARVLGADYRQMLAEAGIAEAEYRSRHLGLPGAVVLSASRPADLPRLLASELTEVERLKHAGQPLAALGAVDAFERIARHMGGVPRSRESQVLWAGFLSARVGILHDTLPSAWVIRQTRSDLATFRAIGREFAADTITAVSRFHEGDVLYKAGRPDQARACYAWTAEHAPHLSLRVRGIAGLALTLTESDRVRHAAEVRTLYAQAVDRVSEAATRDRLASRIGTDAPGFGSLCWSIPDYWTAAEAGCDIWTAEIFSRALLAIGARAEAVAELQRAEAAHAANTARGRSDACLAVALQRSRLRAALAGAIDLSERDIQKLGAKALALATAGSFTGLSAEIVRLTSGVRVRVGTA